MKFFNDISEFKTYVGGAVNLSVELASMMPTILDVAHEIIEPWLDATTFAAISADTLPTSGIHGDLLPYVQRALAKLSLFQYSKIGTIQLSGDGFTRTENEARGVKTPYKYQENDYRSVHHHYGYEALERMLQYLDQNEDTYPDWKGSTARTRNRALFIMYASEMRQVHDKKVSRYVYETIRYIIAEVEGDHIEPLIGTPFFDELKTKHLAKTLGVAADENDAEQVALADKEKKLLLLLQKAIAHMSIQQAIKRNWLFFDGDKVGVKERLEPQGYEREGTAGGQAVSLKLRAHLEQANRFTHKIHAYLQLNIESFPTYKTWWETLYPPTEEEEESLSREDCPTPTKKRSIIRF